MTLLKARARSSFREERERGRTFSLSNFRLSLAGVNSFTLSFFSLYRARGGALFFLRMYHLAPLSPACVLVSFRYAPEQYRLHTPTETAVFDKRGLKGAALSSTTCSGAADEGRFTPTSANELGKGTRERIKIDTASGRPFFPFRLIKRDNEFGTIILSPFSSDEKTR